MSVMLETENVTWFSVSTSSDKFISLILTIISIIEYPSDNHVDYQVLYDSYIL